jgi:S1-C subfamily serine protease
MLSLARGWLGTQKKIIVVVLALVLTAALAFWLGTRGRPAPTAAPKPSASAKPPDQLTAGQIFKLLAPSVVLIQTEPHSIGTGVVVNANGTILTAHHVVKDATSIEVTFADGATAHAIVNGVDEANDIASLQPDTLPSLVVPAILGGGAAIGDPIVAIGNQLALVDTTTSGVVSGLDRTITGNTGTELKGLIQFDAAVNPGSSGGPLVNAKGQTIGIVVALANPTDAGTFIGVGFAVPISTAVGGGRPPQL